MPKNVLKRRIILVATNLIGLFFYLLDVVTDVMNASLYMRYKTHYIEGMRTYNADSLCILCIRQKLSNRIFKHLLLV